MTRVNTVLGPIDSSELGFTLVHEHLLIGWAGWQADREAHFDRADAMARAVDRLQELKGLGVQTFVDPCPMDIGRDPEFMAEASRRSGMTIVGSTGLYHEAMGIPAHYRGMPEEALAELFIAEIEQGMAHTDIRAGIIKTATNANQVTEQEAKVHRAAGRARAATGTPIITHTDEKGPMGLEQLDLFAEAGADPAGIAIGHSCGVGRIPYLLAVLERGAMLSFDRFGFGISASDDVRIASLMALLALGHADKVMLSHDSLACVLGRGFAPPPHMAALLENWHPTHLITNIFPRLKAIGVTDDTIHTLMVANPRRYFEGAAANPV